MLSALRSYVNAAIAPKDFESVKPEQEIKLAAATLLVEVAAADFEQHPEELDAVSAALEKSYTLDGDQVAQLLLVARHRQENATSLYEFTSVINEHCSQDEKFAILVQLWRVAFADGHLDKYEDHRIRRIADLLHLSHRQFIQAKHAAEK